jgi:arylsulfatase A-like enzyme/tetratricopeptide (TPR) repeat protein
MKLPSAAAAAIVAALLAGGCGGPRPNVLVVTFDTVRWDHVGWASGRAGLTPMLDAMAARGVWFETALTSQPLTLPAHTSILTGRYPYHHGVRNNGTYRVPEAETTLAERLRGAGYATHAVISAYVLDSQFGLAQGFDGYDDDLAGGPKQPMFMFKEIRATQTADKAVAWLRDGRPKDRPFFLWLHFFDPHANYDPPPEVAARFPGDPYRGEIHYADHELGRVFQALDQSGELERTLLAFTSDHGDSLGEHGERTHGLFVYESTTRVPLLLAGPGVPSTGRIRALARTIDIVPTVCDLLRLDCGAELDGASLRPLWKGAAEERTAYLETFTPLENFGWSELRALRDGRRKAIEAPRPEGYALDADAGEGSDLLSGAASPLTDERFRDLFGALREIERTDRYGTADQPTQELDEETRQKLGALGYLWAGGPARPAGAVLPDPKDRIVSWDRFQRAQDLLRLRRDQEALAELRAVLAEDPGNVLALGSLAIALVRGGEKQEALRIYLALIEADPQRDNAYMGAARLLSEAGRHGEAHALLERIRALQPDNPSPWVAEGDVLIDERRYDEALAAFRKALELDPHSMLAASGLSNGLNRAGRTAEARDVLTAARAHDPTHAAITYNLAVVVERLGDPAGAEKLYRELLRIEPEHSMAWNNLGSLLHKQGKLQPALEMIARAHELDRDNLEATYNLGALLLTSGKPAEAVPLLEEAARRGTAVSQAAPFLARALEASGRPREALRLWRELAEKNPPALLQVARLELEAGNAAAARRALDRLVAADGERARQAIARHPALARLLAGA